jgi:hypothetical protein
MNRVVRTLVFVLFASVFVVPVASAAPSNGAASETALLTICTSLKNDKQYISTSGTCNERIYEKSTWYHAGTAPSGTLGSKTVSISLCSSKSTISFQTLPSAGKSCNRTTQIQSIWERPLGPPAPPAELTIAADLLGTAIVTAKAPVADGGARVRSYQVVEVDSSNTSIKTLATAPASFPNSFKQSMKITGLNPGQSYKFAIVAINSIGSSPYSVSPTNFVAPNLPGAASITTAEANSYNSARITFSPAASDGGSPVISYTITAFPGGLRSTFLATESKSYTFTGLSGLTPYTFTISATNIAGTGPTSAASNQTITFAPPPPEPVAPTPVPAPAQVLAAPAFTLSSASEIRTVNTAATGFTINSTGGAIATFAISATPAGMSFNTTTGALTGTPTTVASATAYTITATNASGSATQTFTLTVSPAAQTTLSITSLTTSTKAYPYSQVLAISTSGGLGTGATTYAVASGGSATGCALSNATETATVTATTVGTCLIEATKAADSTYSATTSASATFTFTKATPSLSSFANISKYVGNSSFTLTAPAVANSVAGAFTYTSATTSTATISGATVTLGSAGTSLITATFMPTDTANYNSATITMTLTVTLAAPAFTLSSASEIRTVNTAATGFTINSTGGVIATFAISATPAGMSFNTTTGALTGTPTTVASATAYIITATNASGSATQTFTLTVTAVVYAVGATGPSGGKIFYYVSSGFSCGPTLASTCHYLEVAPSGWNSGTEPSKQWAVAANQGTHVLGIDNNENLDSTGVGLGYKNSVAIVAQGNDATSAAGAARAYTPTVSGTTFSDWYLPSRVELNLLCQWARGTTQNVTLECSGANLNSGTGANAGFVANYYWSSSEYNGADAWRSGQAFNDATAPSGKGNLRYVRPIRAF